MSQPHPLPSRPNLEHLKKQAKALLRSLEQSDPEAIKIRRTHQPNSSTAPTLADAQYCIARAYGFESWPKLKLHVDALAEIPAAALELAKVALHSQNAALLRHAFQQYPQLRSQVNLPVGEFDSPPILLARTPAILDVLLEAGADINARSSWWAGGFSLLDSASPELAAYAIQRGAIVTIHAAAHLGDLKRLQQLLDSDPMLVHAPGGDGKSPLHFASNIEIAACLLDRGAAIDARDLDHESTPAQYMVKSRPELARYLIQRGCQKDILMAAALGDVALVRSLLAADPACIRTRVVEEYFPMVGGPNGGTIYQWELGWYVSAAQVAKSFGHPEILDLILRECPPDEKLLNACWLHDEPLVRQLLAADANLAESLPPASRRHLAHAARNNDTAAARLMLLAHFPVNTWSQHHGTPLQWAAWHGNLELVQLLLPHSPALESTEDEYHSTAMGWAIHGSENGWHRLAGNYPATVQALLDAGAKPPGKTQGSAAVKALLRQHGVPDA